MKYDNRSKLTVKGTSLPPLLHLHFLSFVAIATK